MELGVVGDEDFILGFKLVGIRKIFVPTKSDPLEVKLNEALQDDEIGILVMEDKVFKSLDTLMQNQLAESIQPTVITIGFEEDVAIREKIKQAIGVDLWK
ncbi:MAG: V-type ATP synthase subunit F [Thermoplasmata archaeon]|nr:MAG: V-type ATP synthase subunit F [Thermoplasmata archaeon]